MANELVRFTSGLLSNMNNEPIEAGKVLFAINDDGDRGKIFLDLASTRIPVAGMPYWKDITPLKSKTYTDIIGSSNDYAGAAFHFAKVKPSAYTDVWEITYVIRARIQNQVNGVQDSLVHISGMRNTYSDYWVYNVISDTAMRPLYYHEYRPIKQAGFNAGYFAYIGVGMHSSTNPTNASYKRNFEIDLIEAVNCLVEFLNTMTKTASISEMTSTNYENAVLFDGTTRGITITGDRNSNTFDRTKLVYNNLVAGTNGIKQYSLIMRDANNNWQSLTTTNGTGNTKTKNAIGFHYNRIYYYSGSGNVAAGAKTNNETVYIILANAIDLRYSSNCGTTLVADKPVYLVGTVGSDGLFYLDDTWWTLTIPTSADGKVYLYIGEAYNTYRMDFVGYNSTLAWYHDGTAFVPYFRATHAINDSSGNKITTSYVHSGVISGHTLTLKDIEGSTLSSLTLPDTTYNAGTGLTLSGTTFKAKLKSETNASSASLTLSTNSNRYYAVVPDSSGYLSVNVPWSNTTYSASNNGITLETGNVFTLSLVSTIAATEAAITAGSATGKYYPVGLDKNKKLVVNVPWSNTTYTAGTGLSLSSNQFTNTGIITLAEGTSNGLTKVNGTDTTIVKGLNDLAYIAKDGTSSTKFLKGDGTWAVPTDHTYSAGAGLSLSGSTFAVKLKNGATKSSLTGNTISTTNGRLYYIELDNADKLSVNVPWTDTTYSASNKGITLATDNVFTLSLVSDTAVSEAAATAGSATGKYYPVALDKNSKLVVNVPWSNTTYTAGTGLSLSGNQFSNTGIVTLAIGTSNGKTKVNGTETSLVYGLTDLAFLAYPTSDTTTKYLRGDGTWVVPPDHTYAAGAGLTLSGSTFAVKLKNGATKSTITANAISTTANRSYYVEMDAADKMSVNVPWTDTTYTASGNGISLSSQLFSLALKSTTKATYDSETITNTQYKQYAVVMDKSGYLSVNVPWSNTTYSASTGLTLSSNQFAAKLRTTTALTNDSAAATETANRIYSVVVDKSGYLSVVVPWTDTDTNTDTKVTQSADTQNNEYPIIMKNSTTTTAETAGVKFNSTSGKQTTVNPSTGTVSANIFRVATKVKLEYNSTTEALNFVFV